MNFLLKSDDRWKSQEAANAEFMDYGIAGFSGGVPELCFVVIHINWHRKRLEYPAINCPSITFARSGTFKYFPLPNSLHSNVDLALSQAESAQRSFRDERFLANLPTLLPIFSDAPLELQKVAANAVALIQVESSFNPKHVGGTPIVGVIAQGKLPVVAQFTGP